MAINWWVVGGLSLDVVGVVIVGYCAERWLDIFFDGTRDFRRPWQRWAYRAAWGMIAGGFLLQIVGQLPGW